METKTNQTKAYEVFSEDSEYWDSMGEEKEKFPKKLIIKEHKLVCPFCAKKQLWKIDSDIQPTDWNYYCVHCELKILITDS